MGQPIKCHHEWSPYTSWFEYDNSDTLLLKVFSRKTCYKCGKTYDIFTKKGLNKK